MPDPLVMSLAIALHQLATVVWVGGMFFAYLVLRPAAGPLGDGVRFLLWRRVFARFLPWVWASVVVLLASGYLMIFGVRGGFGGVGVHVHVMQVTGIVMMLVFLHLYFAPWRRFRQAVDVEDVPLAARELDRIRLLVLINLILGIITAVVGASGGYW